MTWTKRSDKPIGTTGRGLAPAETRWILRRPGLRTAEVTIAADGTYCASLVDTPGGWSYHETLEAAQQAAEDMQTGRVRTGTAHYRVVDAPGFGSSRSNVVYVHGYYTDAHSARRAASRDRTLIAQGGEFDAAVTEDWMDWAHRGGYAAGALRQI